MTSTAPHRPTDLLPAAREAVALVDADPRAPTKLLVQAGEYDSIVPRRDAEVLGEQASEPVEVRWYEADHELGQQAAVERVEWLVDVLGLR